MRVYSLHAGTRPAVGFLRQSLGLLRDAARAGAATFRLWRQRHRDRRELARLDDRTLRDIGVTRADAEFLINKPFWRE